MKILKSAFLALVLLSSTASARPLLGEVYGVYPEGVMVRQGLDSFLVPVQQASFSIGGVRASWSTLVPGQQVNIQIPDPYWPDVTRVADPYAWKMMHHPGHPHGGPPGQMKKRRGFKNGKHKHKRRGRGRR